MYIIMEIQQSSEGVTSTIVTTKDNKAEADSTYYSILASAALSSLPIHGAVLMDECGFPLIRGVYDRRDQNQ